jgi:hypothetical protein
MYIINVPKIPDWSETRTKKWFSVMGTFWSNPLHTSHNLNSSGTKVVTRFRKGDGRIVGNTSILPEIFYVVNLAKRPPFDGWKYKNVLKISQNVCRGHFKHDNQIIPVDSGVPRRRLPNVTWQYVAHYPSPFQTQRIFAVQFNVHFVREFQWNYASYSCNYCPVS